jgi:hypothetical protein
VHGQVLKDEHGREVFGSDRSAVMAMFLNEGGVVSGHTDACSLRELRHRDESKVQVLQARAAARGDKQSTLDWSRIRAEVANARERRDLMHEYLQDHFRTKAEAADEQLSDELRSYRAMVSDGYAGAAMSLMPRAAQLLDERGREVSGIELDDALTTFLNEGGVMSTDGCSLPWWVSCSCLVVVLRLSCGCPVVVLYLSYTCPTLVL